MLYFTSMPDSHEPQPRKRPAWLAGACAAVSLLFLPGTQAGAADAADAAGAQKGAAAAASGLVFYQTCNNTRALLQPKIGPAGTLTGAPAFIKGHKGKAYLLANTETSRKLFYPGSIVPTDRGTIECWAKLINPPTFVGQHSSPEFFACESTVPGTTFQLGFNANDGFGGGGLVAWAGHGNLASGDWFNSFSYAEILGGADQVELWHHYALAWDTNGIAGTTFHLQLYLDGNPVGTVLHDADQFPAAIDFGLGMIDDDFGNGSFAIDEVKIWNYAHSPFKKKQGKQVEDDDQQPDGDG